MNITIENEEEARMRLDRKIHAEKVLQENNTKITQSEDKYAMRERVETTAFARHSHQEGSGQTCGCAICKRDGHSNELKY